MMYVGGKAQIATWIEKHVMRLAIGKTHYVEPFVGSGATFARLAPHFSRATARDAHPDLVLMWQALAEGWEPPEHVTREEHARLKHEIPSALRGFVGFGASFGGVWLGGYAAPKTRGRQAGYSYVASSRSSVLRKVPIFQFAEIESASFESLQADSSMLIYCDPPYAGRLGYRDTQFDSSLFWNVARDWACHGATVIVSEESAPSDWPILAVRERKAMLQKAELKKRRRELLVWLGEFQ